MLEPALLLMVSGGAGAGLEVVVAAVGWVVSYSVRLLIALLVMVSAREAVVTWSGSKIGGAVVAQPRLRNVATTASTRASPTSTYLPRGRARCGTARLTPTHSARKFSGKVGAVGTEEGVGRGQGW